MDWLQQHPTAAALALLLGIVLAWLVRLNSVLTQTPPDALATSPNRWTEQEIKEAYERVQKQPIDWSKHLPPKLNRRYIIVGGSGGVGGQIILHLLERGQPAGSIRNVDFAKPGRPDMLNGPAKDVDFVQADITSIEATRKAFLKPWDDSVANLPLTVFHMAAAIVFNERSMATFWKVKRVNIEGTQHVLDAAKAAGADVFVSTSSASVALHPIDFWSAPWRRWPKDLFQAVDESDFFQPLRPHEQFFGNYPHSKAVAERLVCSANSSTFRTGVIRPSNGIYGSSIGDQLVGRCLRSESFPSWTPNFVHNLVHTGNVSLGHLLFEAALVNSKDLPKCAGRPFNIADRSPPTMFGDLFKALEIAAVTPIQVMNVPPVPLLLLAYVVEFMDTISRIPGLAFLQPKGEVSLLQPPVFTASTHMCGSDAAARKSIDDGGLGYKGACTTLEGVCQQIWEWNLAHGTKTQNGKTPNGKAHGNGVALKLAKDVATTLAAVQARNGAARVNGVALKTARNIATMPAAAVQA